MRCPGCEQELGEIWSRGEIRQAEAERILELLTACPEPDDRFCDCAAHRALYAGHLKG